MSSDTPSGEAIAMEMKRFIAVLGLGLAIILLIERRVKKEQIKRLCKETRLKHEELNQQRKLRAEAVERTCQKERTLISTRRQYDEKLRKSDQEYKDVVNTLTSARIQIRQKDEEFSCEQSLRIEAAEKRNRMESILAFTRKQSEERLHESNQECTRLRRQYEECRQTLSATRAKVDSLKAEAVESTNAMERTLASTRRQYQQTLRTSNQECTRLCRQYDECCQTLSSTRAQVECLNSELRDWIIPRDEIEISERVLGCGGWGCVREGTFRGTKVAVKQMHELIVSPHNRRLFGREMKMAARGRHPNLLLFIGATNDDGIALLVTELLDTNLRTVLDQRPLRSEEISTLSLDVSRALNYLHMNKPLPIIHRDISSANVLLFKREEAWHAKLSDYGSANFMKDLMTESPGAVIYAAPEARTSTQSSKVDVYSFGLLLCEMCTRELPVPDQTNVQLGLITNGCLQELVQQCVNETPRNRPTMDNVVATLQNLMCTFRQ